MGHYSNPGPLPDHAAWRARAERRYRRSRGLADDHDLRHMGDDVLHVVTDGDPLVIIVIAGIGMTMLGFAAAIYAMF